MEAPGGGRDFQFLGNARQQSESFLVSCFVGKLIFGTRTQQQQNVLGIKVAVHPILHTAGEFKHLAIVLQ